MSLVFWLKVYQQMLTQDPVKIHDPLRTKSVQNQEKLVRMILISS